MSTPPTTGKFKCTLAEYLSYPAVGSSGLRTIISKSPAHYWHDRNHPTDPTPTQAMGTAIHASLLEPKLFKETMTVMPEFTGYTQKGELTTNANCKEVRDKIEQFHIQNHGKMILSQADFDNVQGILNTVSAHPVASKLVADGHSEESLFFTDSETGVACKSRPDFIREGHIVVSIKTTEDASYHSFQKDFAILNYHMQAAMELEACSEVLGGNFDTHITIAIERKAPYGLQIFQLDENSLREGLNLCQQARLILKQCQKTNVYPGYSSAIMPLNLPSWAFKGDL